MDKLNTAISIRMSESDVEALEALRRRVTVCSRRCLAREAMRIGLKMLAEDPARLVEGNR